ncbi:hypothetical protein [Gaetbulibacter aestuarii]|uniref:Bacteriocin n=1 Tax=Gaetbulibacter aestuarii TaxID=1502358 RepID=A0ABW7MUM5_9FLAO
MKTLTIQEQIVINGGHDGTAYEIGKAVGTTLKIIGMVTTVGGVFKFLKYF